jgi:hypothetical protein
MIKFKKMKASYYLPEDGIWYYFLLNEADEILLKTASYEKVKEKKRRLDFIARARGTYRPSKFRITDSFINILN